MLKAMTYHHGNLRRAMLDATAAEAAKVGVGALSLRALARSLGVTHTAIRHHFADKRSLLTALATEGYEQLAEHLRPIYPDSIEAGVAYVEWMLGNPGHFEVMFKPALVNTKDPNLLVALAKMRAVLAQTASENAPEEAAPFSRRARAAWSIVHGYATLAVSGVFGPFDPAEARETILLLADGMGRPTRS